MNDDFEKRLQRAEPRELPSGWREEILTAAKQAATARQATVVARPSLAAFIDQFAALLRPQRAAWATLATAWIAIMLLNLSGGYEPATAAMAKPVSSAQTRMALKQKQMLLIELAGRTEPPAVERRVISPGPRSQRREETWAV